MEEEGGLQPCICAELVEQLLVGFDLLGHGSGDLLVVLPGGGHSRDDHRPDQLHANTDLRQSRGLMA